MPSVFSKLTNHLANKHLFCHPTFTSGITTSFSLHHVNRAPTPKVCSE
jgi:hypothetical protein